MDINQLQPGNELPVRQHTATNVSLFMYNAAVWNHHRIHYDEKYTKEVEKHPGIVIDGPLQGDWLSQVALNWLGDAGQLIKFEYSNRRAAYLGETLTSGGTVTAVDAARGEVELELFIKNDQGEVITPGHATVRIYPASAS
jgi:3-methylfumaryl-CoA hydratase